MCFFGSGQPESTHRAVTSPLIYDPAVARNDALHLVPYPGEDVRDLLRIRGFGQGSVATQIRKKYRDMAASPIAPGHGPAYVSAAAAHQLKWTALCNPRDLLHSRGGKWGQAQQARFSSECSPARRGSRGAVSWRSA